MIKWETLQFQVIQMPTSGKKGVFVFTIALTIFFLLLFLNIYDDLCKDSDSKPDKLLITLILVVLLICGSSFAYFGLQSPYYKITVKAEKPIGFENQLSKVEKDRKYFKALGQLAGEYVVIQSDKDHYFKPYLDCVVDNNSLKVSTIISKKSFESFKTKEEFNNVFKNNVLKQINFVKNYKSVDEIKKEKEDFANFSKEVESVNN